MSATTSLPRAEVGRLIEEHLPLVRSVLAGVAAHFPRHVDRDELAQAATLGLVEAANRFEPSRGVPFPRWAALRIRGAILDAARACDFAPRSVRGSMRTAESAHEALSAELGRMPTREEVADRAGMTVDDLDRLQRDVHRALVLSLDLPGSAEDDGVAAAVVEPGPSDPADVLEQREQAAYLEDSLAALPPRLRDVVESYFLHGETSADIAARLGVTQSRVSQMRSEGLALMRAGLATVYDPALGMPPVRGATASARVASYSAAVAARSDFAGRVTARRRPPVHAEAIPA